MSKFGLKAHKGNANVFTVLFMSTANSRYRIYDWAFSSGDTPGDAEFIHTFQRGSSNPTGSAVVPFALDPSDTLAATGTFTDTVTADGGMIVQPTFRKALNQRATFRWVAAPYGELVVNIAGGPTSATLGLTAATTVGFDYDVYFDVL